MRNTNSHFKNFYPTSRRALAGRQITIEGEVHPVRYAGFRMTSRRRGSVKRQREMIQLHLSFVIGAFLFTLFVFSW